MNLKVKHNELMNVQKTLVDSADKLDNEINVWLNSIERLRNIWQGDDADIFYNKSNGYVSRMKVISNSFKTIGEFIIEADSTYTEKDRKLKDNMKKEAFNYE